MLPKIAIFGLVLSCMQAQAWVRLDYLNYSMCECSIGGGSGRIATTFQLMDQVSGGVFYSCLDSITLCPQLCESAARLKINSKGYFDRFCKTYKKAVLPPKFIKLFAYSDLPNYSQVTQKKAYLKKKICCMHIQEAKRWIGYSC